MAEKTEAEFSDNDRIAYCECGFFWTVPTGMPWRDCENCDEAPIDLIASYKALAQQDQGTGVGEAVRHHLELAIEAKDRQASDDRIRAALSMLNLPATPEPQQEEQTYTREQLLKAAAEIHWGGPIATVAAACDWIDWIDKQKGNEHG